MLFQAGVWHMFITVCYKHQSFKHSFKLWLTAEDVHTIINITSENNINIMSVTALPTS